MYLPEYFVDVVRTLNIASEGIRRDFASHRPSAGANREDLLKDFLEDHLPNKFGVDTGLIAATNGQFSKQADLIITDDQWNWSFYSSGPNKIYLVEGVYALIEVKTNLTRPEMEDAISKCRRFKTLPRKWSEVGTNRLHDSLFVVWSYDSPNASTVKENLVELLENVPIPEQPDFFIVPGQYVISCGSYRELSGLGQPESSFRRDLIERYGNELKGLNFNRIPLYELGENSLFVWFIWFLSWLNRAGVRAPELLDYLPPEKEWGRVL